MRLLVILFCFFMITTMPAHALHPDEKLADAVQERRARDLSRHLRCLVCQGEAIDESAAPLARDLRRVVREKIAAGATDKEVLDFMRDRYGDYVLMQPPLSGRTAFLFIAPLAVMAAGGVVVYRYTRRRSKK